VLNFCVAIVCEMEAYTEHSLVCFKQHAVIEFLTAQRVSPIEMHCRMLVVCCGDCVDVSTVSHTAQKCKVGEQGRAGLCDRQRSGRPLTATNEFHKT
jgi:hypothetical protein